MLSASDFFKRFNVGEDVILRNKQDIIGMPSNWKTYCNKTHVTNSVLLPVSNIKSISRIDKELSWYDAFVQSFSSESLLDIVERKLSDLYNSLYVKGALEAVFNCDRFFYFDCIVDYDCYSLRDDGNHRILIAKNIGVEYVLAKEVTYYQVDYNRKKEYDEYMKKLEVIDSILDKYKEFTLVEDEDYNGSLLDTYIFLSGKFFAKKPSTYFIDYNCFKESENHAYTLYNEIIYYDEVKSAKLNVKMINILMFIHYIFHVFKFFRNRKLTRNHRIEYLADNNVVQKKCSKLLKWIYTHSFIISI